MFSRNEKTIICLLGGTPPVVTSFVDHFLKKSNIKGTWNIIVIANKNEKIIAGAGLVQAALAVQYKQLSVRIETVEIEDVTEEKENFAFLRTLARIIAEEQKKGRDIILNVTGGRVSMSLSAQNVGQMCDVEGIYCITTKQDTKTKETLESKNVSDIVMKFGTGSPEENKKLFIENSHIFQELMFPNKDQKLVRIPTIPHNRDNLTTLLHTLQEIEEGRSRLSESDKKSYETYGYIIRTGNSYDLSEFGREFLQSFTGL